MPMPGGSERRNLQPRVPGLRAVTIEVRASGVEGADEGEVERAIDAARRIGTLYH
jgi:hypothetical protein